MTTVTKRLQYRTVATLFTAQGLFSASVIAAFTLTPVIAAELSGSDATAGVPSTLSLLGRASFAYFIGWFMDKVGRRYGLTLGYFIGVVGGLISLLGVFMGSFWLFILGSLFLGFMRGAADQGRYVAAEVFPAGERTRIIGFIIFAGTIGAIGGPRFVPLVSEWSLARGLPEGVGLFALASLFLLGGGFIVLFLLRPDPLEIGKALAQQSGEESAVNDKGAGRASLSELFSQPMVRLAILAMVIGQLVMVMVMVITPLHMDHLGQGSNAISWVITAHTLGMFGLSWFTGWLIDQLGQVTMIIIGAVVLMAACLLAPLTTAVPVLGLALFLLGLGWNFCFVSGSSLLADSVPAGERGRSQGAAETLVALGAGTGGLSSGPIFDLTGMAILSGAGLVLAVGLIVMTMITARPGRIAPTS